MDETRPSLLLRAQTGETDAWKDLTDLGKRPGTVFANDVRTQAYSGSQFDAAATNLPQVLASA